MLLAKLPPGRYQVVAEARGLAETVMVDAGGGSRRMTMHWPATVDEQGWDTSDVRVLSLSR